MPSSKTIAKYISLFINLYIYSITVLFTHQLIGQSIFQANALSGYKFPAGSAVTRTSSFVSMMANEDLPAFDIMSAFEELLKQNINITENAKESGKWKCTSYRKKEMDIKNKELNLLVEKGADQ